MPSTRRQRAKARKSREMDVMSDLDNLDVMLGNGNENPIERELADVIEQSSTQGDYETNEFHEADYRNFVQGNEPFGQNDVRQSFETFSNEFNLRLSQEMNSMMTMVHNQINRAISTAISERVIPEIQNIVSSMSSSGNRDTEASLSPNSQEIRENSSGLKTKKLKKDSRSVGDLRDTTGRGSYMVTGANEAQQPIPDFPTVEFTQSQTWRDSNLTTMSLCTSLCQPQKQRLLRIPRTL